MTRKIAILVALVAAATIAPAGARGARQDAPIPVLIEQAVSDGSLDRAAADLYLAYAFTDPTRIPERYRGRAPWHGTTVLLGLQERLERMPQGAERAAIVRAMGPFGTGTTICSLSVAPFPFTMETEHFSIEYPSPILGGGLTIEDYAAAMETSWSTEVDSFGWAAPPLNLDGKYTVRVDPTLPLGLYGFVAARENVGDNPHTSWDDGDAHSSCLVLNGNFDSFFYPSAPIDSLTSTAAHEFLHSLQFGYGALTGPNAPDIVFSEGSASWVEDEVFDGANDNYNFLWPNLDESLGEYTSFPYNYWVVFRGLTERFGAGVPGGGEQVFQDFFEETSKGSGDNLTALTTALANKGIAIGEAFHDAGIAMSMMKACGGGYALPHCYEEAEGYVAVSGQPPSVRGFAALGATSFSVRDDLTFIGVELPIDVAPYDVTVTNTDGGSLRGSVICDTGSGATVSSVGPVLGAGESGTVSGFDTSGCERALLVVSNEEIGAANPTSSQERAFDVNLA